MKNWLHFEVCALSICARSSEHKESFVPDKIVDMLETLPIEDLVDRTPNGIAQAVGRLISTGELAVGQKLPTVRACARQMGVSPTTVGDAWRILQGHGAIATEGRRGTFVRASRQGAAPGRYWRVPVDPDTYAVDLSTGTPDPNLLPSAEPAFGRGTLDLPVSSYLDAPVLPMLEAELRDDWPFVPELLTIVNGAQDGLDRLVRTLVNVGDVVLVNDPAFPPLLDMIDAVGGQVIGIRMDEEGALPDEVATAVEHGPVAFFVQPRAHNPTGVSTTPRRAEELAAVLHDTNIVIVEDDHSAYVSGSPLASLGEYLPDKVVHIRSFSKSHGPDLRLAAVGGAAAPIDSVVRGRRMGPSWTSRLLQQVLLSMLQDASTQAFVRQAEAEYVRRRASWVDALEARGVAVGGGAGINLWVPVEDEQNALVALAANGVGAAPGTPFCVNPSSDSHIRVSIGRVADEVEALADLIALAANVNLGGSR